MRLQLKKFDMSSIAADKVVVMIGKRDTGKSFLCKDLYGITKKFLFVHLYLRLKLQLFLWKYGSTNIYS